MQIIISSLAHTIMCVATGKGSIHDLTLFRKSEAIIHTKTPLIADSEYQGVQNDHKLSITPHKASKNHSLDKEQKQENKVLAHFRQPIEHVIRKLKVFRVLKEVYRHRRRRFDLRVNIIAGLINRMAQGASP